MAAATVTTITVAATAEAAMAVVMTTPAGGTMAEARGVTEADTANRVTTARLAVGEAMAAAEAITPTTVNACCRKHARGGACNSVHFHHHLFILCNFHRCQTTR
uniref:10.7 kDa Putative secreted Ala-rich peptide n=1 Tax=Argas monolakensis TaxID=34602 RepID=Q09JK6_ARGMO|nr:10.7 kDa Putative secreted Ala-rich peptide [Argas monolakensis]